VADAHCMSCRTGWNREFIDLNTSKAFRIGDWREHKKIMILNREKAILPTMQRYAAAKKQMEHLVKVQLEQSKDTTLIHSERNKLSVQLSTIRNTLIYREITPEEEKANWDKLDELRILMNMNENKYYKQDIINSKTRSQYERQIAIYNDTDVKVKGERKEFILKCVKDGCRGFLSSSYKCELCSTFVCKECMIIKDEKNDDNHICKKEDVDTVTMIRKDTRPCPKCGIRISKIDGCDQMWCVAEGCGTAFSWMNGTVISGVIHNPHYYEWVRRNNNGVVPRNDIPAAACGQNVQYHDLWRAINTSYITPRNKNTFSSIHRCIIDVAEYRLQSYPQTRDPNMFKELHCSFLLNVIQEDAWRQSMFLKENNFEKKQQIGLVLRTFVTVCQDTMNKLYQELILFNNEYLKNSKNIEEQKKVITASNEKMIEYTIEFEKIRNYINDSLVTLGTTVMCAVPQIEDTWEWIAIAKVEKILAARQDKIDKKNKAPTA